jgi:hypothetical protein
LLISPPNRDPDPEVIAALKADVNDLRANANDLTTKVRYLEEFVERISYDPHHRLHITQTASHGNIRDLTGHTTTQLNRQELAFHRSDAETPDNGILGFFGSLFH